MLTLIRASSALELRNAMSLLIRPTNPNVSASGGTVVSRQLSTSRASSSFPDLAKADKGFGREQLSEMRRIIEAERSDLFDVLARVAYALPPLTRDERASKAKVAISTHFNSKQQVFLDFVLSHYISQGVEELDQEKLTPLLRLKYRNSISDAVADLGQPEQIG